MPRRGQWRDWLWLLQPAARKTAAAPDSLGVVGPFFPWLTIFLLSLLVLFVSPNAKSQIRRSIVAEQVALTH
jgi:hypothetical protein